MSLILWMPLDGNTNDYTVNNNTGVNTNVTFVNGKIGQAGSFNGTSSTVIFPLLSFANEFSYALWVNTSNTTDTRMFFGGNLDTNSNIKYGFLAGNLFVRVISSSQQVTIPNISNIWTHIVIKRNSDNKVDLFINGVGQRLFSDVAQSGTTFLNIIGNVSDGSNQRFLGSLNDVRVYDHALSQKEINNLAKAKVLHYTFNKDDGNIVYDNSGLKRNATVNGATWTDQGYSFNGSTNSIERPMLDSLGVNSFTINLWAYFEQTNVRDVILGTFNGSNPLSFNFEKHTSNRLRFYWQGTTDIFSANDVVPIQQRCMLTLIRDKEQGRIKMFVNGQNVVNQVATASDITSFDNRTLFIGRDIRTTSEATNGKLDDIVFYTTALSDANILDMYQTRAKIDNQGNLYANEFVEDYEVAPGLTLTQLFDTLNTDADFSEGTSGWTAHGSSTYSVSNGNMFVTANGTQVYGWLYKNNSAANGRTYYINLRARVTNPNALNISYWVSGFQVIQANPAQNQWYLFSNVYTHGSSGAFTLLEHRYADTATSSGKVMEVDFYYFYDITDKITTLGYTPTKAQLDTWFNDYEKSRVKSNGQIITNEFNEVGIDTIAYENKTYREIFETNNGLLNYNFNNGTTDWTPINATLSNTNNELNINQSTTSGYVRQLNRFPVVNNGDQFFSAVDFKLTGTLGGNFRMNVAYSNTGELSNNQSQILITPTEQNKFFTLTDVVTANSTDTHFAQQGVGVWLRYSLATTYTIDNVVLIRLNTTFASVPTQAQMDQLYTEYRQLKTEEQALRIFRDKIHIQGSLNEGGQ